MTVNIYSNIHYTSLPRPWLLNLGEIQIKWPVQVCMSGRRVRKRRASESDLCLVKPLLNFLLHYAAASQIQTRVLLRWEVAEIGAAYLCFCVNKRSAGVWQLPAPLIVAVDSGARLTLLQSGEPARRDGLLLDMSRCWEQKLNKHFLRNINTSCIFDGTNVGFLLPLSVKGRINSRETVQQLCNHCLFSESGRLWTLICLGCLLYIWITLLDSLIASVVFSWKGLSLLHQCS